MTYNVFSGTLNPTHSLTHAYLKCHENLISDHVFKFGIDSTTNINAKFSGVGSVLVI